MFVSAAEKRDVKMSNGGSKGHSAARFHRRQYNRNLENSGGCCDCRRVRSGQRWKAGASHLKVVLAFIS
jgi:hypothetical protein